MLSKILKRGIWIFLGSWVVFVCGSALFFWQGVVLWRTLGETLFRIFLLALFLLLNAALGKKFFKWLKIESHSFLESSLFSLGLGLAIFTHLLIGLAVAGLFNQWSINLLLLGVFLVSYREIESIIQQIKVKFGNLLPSDISWLGIILLLVLVVQVFFNLAGASVLPSGWDALGEHLARAKEWIRLHSLEAIPYINYPQRGQPFNVGMLYGMSLLIKDAILAKLIHFSFGILTAIGVYALGKRYFSSKVGLFSAAIFYTIPAVAYLSTTAYVDLGLTFYAFLALYAFINWAATNKRGWLIVSAIMSGLCAGSKYAGFLPMTILVLGILFQSWFIKKEKLITVGKNLLLFVLLAGLAGSFWYVRDFIIYGRLVPLNLAFSLWHSIKNAFWRMVTLGPFNPENLPSALAFDFSFIRDKALVPWKLTMYGSALKRVHDPGGVGVLFLAFLPFLLLPRFRKNRVMRFVLYYSLIFFVVWMLFSPIKRYLIPIFPLLSIMVAYIMNQLWEAKKTIRIPLSALLILTLIFQVVYIAPKGLSKIYQCVLVLAGVTSQEDYIMKNEETYPVYQFINGNLSSEAKLLIMDIRAFYCDRPYITSIIGKDGGRYGLGKGKELLAELKKLGISHIVANQSSWDRQYGKGTYPQVLQEIRADHLRVIYDRLIKDILPSGNFHLQE
ncbi:glycosyltransferase family 39 protein, partial [Candidatus Aerophobetes bacterium]